MSSDRVVLVEQSLDLLLAGAGPAPDGRGLEPDQPLRAGTSLTAGRALELFEDQVLSRALDVEARELKKRGEGYYTISSAGHEQNAIAGALLRTTDPCFLHYRSGAFMMARARQRPGTTPLFDTLLSLVASAEDPISGGRHKVWGSRELWVPPQTSTIASHLPKAVGLAFALSRARRLGHDTGLPADSIVLASFGDASVNHATALSAINAARYGKRRDNPMPILFLCEDNRRGISVETPQRWIRDFYSRIEHLTFFEAEGELDELWDTIQLAITTCRRTRSPVFLRLDCVRLWGHAGSDVESTYLTLEEIEAIEARDPLQANARRLIELGAATPAELRELVADARERVHAAALEAARRPKLTSLEEVVRPLAPYDQAGARAQAALPIDPDARRAVHGPRLPEEETSPTRRTLAALVNACLTDEMIRRPELLVFGEDVGKKGGVYGVTQGLQRRFGIRRVFDTLLDETTILGVAQGAAHVGFLPVPEIQYLAYVHNAIDQLRGEACSLQYFSSGKFQNPMVVRIAGLAYQKGFGGHFHNDNALGALREIPGLAIACPARGDDAVRLLRGALAMAKASGRVVCFLEPIALYHERDLHAPGDGLWLTGYPAPGGGPESASLPGEVGLHHQDASELLIVSYANGLRLSLRAARRLEREHGLRARVLDLLWLAPLPREAVRRQARDCGRVLIVDECRASGGVADALIADLAEHEPGLRLAAVRAADTYVPLAAAADLALVSEQQILATALELAR